jgi:hypothetical protein
MVKYCLALLVLVFKQATEINRGFFDEIEDLFVLIFVGNHGEVEAQIDEILLISLI